MRQVAVRNQEVQMHHRAEHAKLRAFQKDKLVLAPHQARQEELFQFQTTAWGNREEPFSPNSAIMDFKLNSAVGCIYISPVIFSITAIVTGFEIRSNTNPSAVEFGDSLEVNCTTTCTDPIINMEYKPGTQHHRTTGSNWFRDYFPSVRAWDFAAACIVLCKSESSQLKEEKMVATVYNREISITSPPEVLEANRTYSLECIGPRVYPNNKLILTWLRGSEIVQSNSTGEQGYPDEDKRLRNVFSFTASVSDDGQVYTCLAEVDSGSSNRKIIANSSVTLQTHSIVTEFEIRINTNPSAVEFGDSLEVNCTTTCTDPIINVEYKPGTQHHRTTGSNWFRDYFPSVRAWDFAAACIVLCKSESSQLKEEKMVVTVYNREINITSPPEVLEANRTYSLECIGPRVYPNNKLILTWLRGSEIVQSNSTGEQGYPDEDKRLRNVFSFTASVSDDGQVYTCLAEVDSGSSNRKIIANSSVTLQTHYKPGDTTISVNNKTVSGFPVNVSKGDEVTLICNSNGNPTPTLKWEDPSNGSNVEIAPPGIVRISHATSEHQGIYKCTATNPYGIDEKEVDIRVTDKPGDTTISVNNKTVSGFPVNVSKGDEVTLICNSNGNPTPTLKWEDPSNGSNVEIAPPGILCIFHATSEHQGIYKCTATNPYGIDEKEVDIRVTVLGRAGAIPSYDTTRKNACYGASAKIGIAFNMCRAESHVLDKEMAKWKVKDLGKIQKIFPSVFQKWKVKTGKK
ncbi:vascular cell adhesion protein 1-like [Mustelus asterias]